MPSIVLGAQFDAQPGQEGNDTYIDSRSIEGRTDQNYGNEARLQIGHADASNSNTLATLIQFDLSALPATDITQACVILKIASPEAGLGVGTGTATTVAAHKVTGAWTENAVTWATQPPIDSAIVDSAAVKNISNETVAWDITALYRSWKAGTTENHGVLLTPGPNNGEGFFFASSDSTDPAARPMLRVVTGAPQGTGKCGIGSPAQGNNVVLSFNSLPSQQGWTYATRNGTPESRTYSATNGALIQNTLGLGSSEFATYRLPRTIGVPFTLNFRARVPQTEVASTGAPATVLIVWVDDGTYYYGIGLNSTSMQVPYASGRTVAIDARQFHDFTIVGTTGNVQIFVDGNLVHSGAAPRVGSSSLLGMGNASSFEHGTVEITRYEYLESALPATAEIPTSSGPSGAILDKPMFGAYDPGSNRLIAYFQSNTTVNSGVAHQVWVMSNANGNGGPAQWSQLATSGAGPVNVNAEAAVTYDPSGNQLFVYGGCFATCSPATSDTFILSNANGLGGTPTWTRINALGASARTSARVIRDPASDRIVSFGGNTGFFGTDRNDLRVLTDATRAGGSPSWNALAPSGSAPPIRSGPAVVFDATANRMILHGGTNLIQSCCPVNISDYSDTWVLSNANGASGTPSWLQLAPSGETAPARWSHSSTYDATANRLYLFGGLSWSDANQTFTSLNDLWLLSNASGSGGTPSWSTLLPSGAPLPRLQPNPILGFDTNTHRLVVAGVTSTAPSQVRVFVVSLDPTTPPPPGTNTTPVANAGTSRTVQVGSLVTLDGSASRDPDGDTLTFTWTLLSKPIGSVAVLANANTARPSFQADKVGTYLLRLTVDDGRGGRAFAATQVLATSEVSVDNPPVAVAGPDRVGTRELGVILDGSGSYDPDGDPILEFAWRVISKPAGSTARLTRLDTPARQRFNADRDGRYVVRLTVQSRSKTATDDVAIQLGATPPPPPPPPPANCPLPGECSVMTDSFGAPYVQCRGRKISQTISLALQPFAAIDSYTIKGCTALWRLKENSVTGGYYSNDTLTGTPSSVKTVTQRPNPDNQHVEIPFINGGRIVWLFDSKYQYPKNPEGGEAYFSNCFKPSATGTPFRLTGSDTTSSVLGNRRETLEDVSLSADGGTLAWKRCETTISLGVSTMTCGPLQTTSVPACPAP